MAKRGLLERAWLDISSAVKGFTEKKPGIVSVPDAVREREETEKGIFSQRRSKSKRRMHS